MRFFRPLLLAIVAAPYATFAQMADNAVPAQQDSNSTLPQTPAASASDTNMITSALADPTANADDLGLAQPGSNLSLPGMD